MTSPESIELIRRVKEGDRKAWAELWARYYPLWLKKFHGKLGRELRRECDTEDVVQSAMTQVLRDVKDLRSEGAFFAWVCAIIRHKLAQKGKRRGKVKAVRLEEVAEPGKSDSALKSGLATQEEYLELLDGFLTLFPEYQEPMGVLYLRYMEQEDIDGIAKRFLMSERSVHRRIKEGLKLLKAKTSRLPDRSG